MRTPILTSADTAGGTLPHVEADGDRVRCDWGGAWSDPLYVRYHDEEWGVPITDERPLFELLCLEGAQAGLSWSTILHKRDGYRRAFAGFDPERVARFGTADVERLLGDNGIVRNRAKIVATIDNARATLELRDQEGGLVAHLWSFVGGTMKPNAWSSMAQVPAETAESRAMSRDLKRRGFRFVGPTICYAFMQSAGLVNDHSVDCFRWPEVAAAGTPGAGTPIDGPA
jgi:DNA-3-methyladenine glycosylase I